MTTDQPAQPKNTSSIAALLIAFFATLIALAAMAFGFYIFHTTSLASHQNNQVVQSMQRQLSHLETDRAKQQINRLSQVTYLIHLANLQLTLEHHPHQSLKTLLLAQQSLSAMDNAAWTTLKNALNQDITALQSAPMINRDQLFSDIAAIDQTIQQLSSIPTKPILQPSVTVLKNTNTDLPWHERVLAYIKNLKSLFVIRHLEQSSPVLLIPESEMIVKQNMSSQLIMAQWALLHRNQAVYDAALQTVSKWLTQYFSQSAQTASMLLQLAAMQKTQINPALPTIDNTLGALASIKKNASETTPPAVTKPLPLPATPKATIPTPTNPQPTKSNSSVET